ncbi:hypothetical protein [Corallococcus sp. 4LFB]|uniref:hypothetical protein n=1 Tax=Corallococcus sp. 4LFB TaxID=3383249 RepID=UPI0039756DD6
MGGGGWARFLVMPTSFWVKLPMMIVGSILVFTAVIVISVASSSALDSATDSTPDVRVGPGE